MNIIINNIRECVHLIGKKKQKKKKKTIDENFEKSKDTKRQERI